MPCFNWRYLCIFLFLLTATRQGQNDSAALVRFIAAQDELLTKIVTHVPLFDTLGSLFRPPHPSAPHPETAAHTSNTLSPVQKRQTNPDRCARSV